MILDNCFECARPVDDDEWVANWGSCDECFNKHLEKFPIAPKEPRGLDGLR